MPNVDEKSLRRIGDATRKSEMQRSRRLQRVPPAPKNPVHAARFRLRSPLEHGKFAVGRMLQLEVDEDGTSLWLETDREEMLFVATGHQTRWDVGADVSAIWTAAGYAVISEQLMGRTNTGEVVPYGVYSIGAGEFGIDGVLALGFGGQSAPLWAREFAFVGDAPDDPPRQDRGPDGVRVKFWPCTTQLPTWAAYDRAPDTGLPVEVLDALEWADNDPAPGERWGTTSGAKLRRTATLLELYWYKWTPPPPICNLNPDYDPISDPGSPDYDPDDPGFDPDYDASTPKGFWAGTTVECDPDDPGTPPDSVLADPVWWIAPIGWWGWGFAGWGWGFGWGGLGWNYPYWYGAFGAPNYWGGWGYGWWVNRWGGRPPTVEDLPDPDTPVPQPPDGQGEITRECRYGWVVWDWGWRILNVDRDRQLAFIIGEIEFRNRLVVENATPEDCVPTY